MYLKETVKSYNIPLFRVLISNYFVSSGLNSPGDKLSASGTIQHYSKELTNGSLFVVSVAADQNAL